MSPVVAAAGGTARPLLRVVRGDPGAEEVAALVAAVTVLLHCRGAGGPMPGPLPAPWARGPVARAAADRARGRRAATWRPAG